jgi:hypothetical protein
MKPALSGNCITKTCPQYWMYSLNHWHGCPEKHVEVFSFPFCGLCAAMRKSLVENLQGTPPPQPVCARHAAHNLSHRISQSTERERKMCLIIALTFFFSSGARAGRQLHAARTRTRVKNHLPPETASSLIRMVSEPQVKCSLFVKFSC